MSKVNLIFFGFDDSIALIRDLKNYYKDSSKFEVESMDNASEVNQYIATTGNGIFFFKVTNKKDLQDAVSILKAQRKLVKKGFVKPACITSIQNKKIESVLAKYGCMDMLEPTTRAKTMTFKLDFWSKPIVAHLEKIQREEEQKLKKAQAKAEAENKSDAKEDFVTTKPLELQSDFWIGKSKSDYKKILRRWLIRMLGPSPHIGNWVEIESQPGTWRYTLKDPSNKDYVVDDGTWYFAGNKPEFDWKINRWSFPSEAPHLYFYAKDGTVYSRFKYIKGQVEICDNSQFALMREEMILETCDSKFNFEGEHAENEDSENLEGDADNDKLSNLEGKGGAADELGKDLQGKGSEADRLGEDPLAGKGSAADRLGEDPLAGKGSAADRYGEDALDGKGSAADRYGDDPLGGKGSAADRYGDDPLGGKGSAADRYGDDPLSGHTKSAEELEEEKRQNDFDEAALKKHYDGKAGEADRYGDNALSGKGSAADRHGDDPLSGEGASADQFENLSNQEKPSGIGAAGESGPLAGKGSAADRHGDDPLSGEGASADQFENLSNQEKPSGIGAEGESGPLAGKGSAADRHGEDPLAGKSDTDNLGGPLGGKGSEADRHGEDPLAGKVDTDDLGGPLSNKRGANHRKGTDPRKNSVPAEALEKHYKNKPGPDGKPIPPQIDANGNPILDPAALPRDIDGKPIIDPSLLPVDENGVPLIDPNRLPKDIHGNPIIDPDLLPRDENGNIVLDPNMLDGFEKDPEDKDDLSQYQVMDGFGNKPGDKQGEGEFGSIFDREVGGKPAQQNDGSAFDRDKPEGSNRPASQDEEDYLNELKKKKALERANAELSAQEIAEELSKYRAQKAAERERASQQGDDLGDYFNEKKRKQAALKEAAEREQNQNAAADRSRSGKDIYGEDKSKNKAAAMASEMDDLLGGGLTKNSQGSAGQNQEDAANPNLSQQIGRANDAITDEGPDLNTIINGTPQGLNLESGELKVILKQVTEAGNEITFMCEFEDFYEDELVVKSPKNSLPLDSSVKATVSLVYNGSKVKVDVEGQIVEIEELNSKQDTLVVSINAIDPKKYESFITLYQDRQQSINDFMERAKGY